MLQVGTKIKTIDNSGAKWVKCIKVLGKGNKKYATTGNIILITISKFSNRKKVKKRIIYLGLIVAVIFVRQVCGYKFIIMLLLLKVKL